MRCVAVSVEDFTGRVVGAIGISGPIWRLSEDVLKRHARAVAATAARLSAAFGFRLQERMAARTRKETAKA